MTYDTIIVGAGIAGVSAALVLGSRERVLMVEAKEPASGASGVAGGLFSPMAALRGRPVWRIGEAIEAFHRQVDETGGHALYDNRGVLRPAHDAQQATYFKESVGRSPEEAEWLPAEVSAERYPHVHAPFGSMYVRRAGAVNLGAYVRHLAVAATQRGIDTRTNSRVTEWGETLDGAYVGLGSSREGVERIEARRILLCWGQTFLKALAFSHLNLHQVKGQTIRVTYPEGFSAHDLIPLSSKGYVIPQPEHIAIGSSYEHTYATEGPTPEISIALLEKAQYVVPALNSSTIIDAQAGFRVTVPGLRKPIVGPLPGYSRIHAFSGFGSKGLLLAPLLANELPRLLQDTSLIPPELRPRVKS